MVVCQYFLRGACRFGEACRNQHTYEEYNRYAGGNQYNVQLNYNANKPEPAPNGAVDVASLIKVVANDMKTVETSGQWLLSSYTPFKEKPCFPGFEDNSFEEIRLLYYQAQKQQTLDQYKQTVQLLFEAAIRRIQALQSPSQELIKIIQNLYYSPTNVQLDSNPFGVPRSSTIFGNTGGSSTSTLFGNSQPVGGPPNQSPFFSQQPQKSNSVFGGGSLSTSNSVFGQNNSKPQSGSIFGGAPQQHSQTIFGAQNSNHIFGSQATLPNTLPNQQSVFGNQKSVFGAQSNVPQSTFAVQGQNSIFGGQTKSNENISNQNAFSSQPQPLFGNNQSVFQTNQNQSVFGFNQNQPIFGNNQNQSVFHTKQTKTNENIFFTQNQSIFEDNHGKNNEGVFEQQNKNSVFGNNQQSQAFGSSNAQPASNYSSSIFGAKPQQPTQNAPDINLLYSKLEDLNVNEIKAFSDSDFTFGYIPELPPTIDMCR